MMGYGDDRGIIPLICEALFQRISDNSVTDKLSYTVEVRLSSFSAYYVADESLRRFRTLKFIKKRSEIC